MILPDNLPKHEADTLKRFWKYVDKTETCWNWTGTIAGKTDYGRLAVSVPSGSGYQVAAHRYSWELANEQKIPEGMFIDHMCHNSLCVNPAHLRVVTCKQNNENQRGAMKTSKTGIRGVCWDMGQWRATVGHHGKIIRIGRFKSLEDAEAAVIAKRLELFTHNDADRNQSVA